LEKLRNAGDLNENQVASAQYAWKEVSSELLGAGVEMQHKINYFFSSASCSSRIKRPTNICKVKGHKYLFR
jgi:hypothetical protein